MKTWPRSKLNNWIILNILSLIVAWFKLYLIRRTIVFMLHKACKRKNAINPRSPWNFQLLLFRRPRSIMYINIRNCQKCTESEITEFPWYNDRHKSDWNVHSLGRQGIRENAKLMECFTHTLPRPTNVSWVAWLVFKRN